MITMSLHTKFDIHSSVACNRILTAQQIIVANRSHRVKQMQNRPEEQLNMKDETVNIRLVFKKI